MRGDHRRRSFVFSATGDISSAPRSPKFSLDASVEREIFIARPGHAKLSHIRKKRLKKKKRERAARGKRRKRRRRRRRRRRRWERICICMRSCKRGGAEREHLGERKRGREKEGGDAG